MGTVRGDALYVSSTALYISVLGKVWTWVGTWLTYFPAMDIERNAQVDFDVRSTLLGVRIDLESRNNNDVTILSGVIRPRAYCSSIHAV
jgi:hypothetical protein